MINKLVTTFSIVILVLLFILALQAASGFEASGPDSISYQEPATLGLVPIFGGTEVGSLAGYSSDAVVYHR